MASSKPNRAKRLPAGRRWEPRGRGVSACTRNGAFTLIELLVVISIMVIMMGLAATLMRPDLEGRRTREAARALNVYISSARNRAIETGRPCGFILHRLSAAVPAALSMDQVEVPPTFAGMNTGAVVQVIDVTFLASGNYYWPNPANPSGPGYTVLKVRVRSNQFADFPLNNLIHPGDLMQLNGQGPYYTIVVPDPNESSLPLYGQYQGYSTGGSGNPDPSSINFATGNADSANPAWVGNQWLTLRLDPSYAQRTPWPKNPSAWPESEQPVSFSILRQPAKGAETPLQLPAGAVVDLQWSGWSSVTAGAIPFAPPTVTSLTWSGIDNGTAFNGGDVTILFGPTGSILSVSIPNAPNTPYLPTQPIYLLIGEREKIGANVLAGNTNPATMTNWQDLNNVWVSINQQSGFVSTRSITAVSTNNSDVDYVNPGDSNYAAEAVAISRASKHLTSNDQALGGR